MAKAKNKGFKAVFLVGEPRYYSRFGSHPISDFEIKDTKGIPQHYTMAPELEKGYLGTKGGTISIC